MSGLHSATRCCRPGSAFAAIRLISSLPVGSLPTNPALAPAILLEIRPRRGC